MKHWSLCINLQGPMQAWGVESKLSLKNTSLAPSKSGVIGIIASSLGIKRDETDKINTLSQLKFATICLTKKSKFIFKDYQTIANVSNCKGGIRKERELSERNYLSNWHFLALFEGEKELLEKIEYALKYPKWHVYLGRKCCPPACPFIFRNALKNKSINELLNIQGLYQCYKEENQEEKVLNSKSEDDQIISFKDRIFRKRTYYEDYIDINLVEDAIYKIKEAY